MRPFALNVDGSSVVELRENQFTTPPITLHAIRIHRGNSVGARNDVSSKVITQMDIAGPRRGTNTCKTVVTTSIDRFYFTGKEFVDEANVQLVDDIGSKSDAFVLQDNYGVEFVNSA